MNRLREHEPCRTDNAKKAILTDPADSVRTYSGDEFKGDWQSQMRQAIRDPHELCRQLGLDAELADRAAAAMGPLSTLVPPSYLERIEPNNPHDPLLRQVLPDQSENAQVAGFVLDPVGDVAASLEPGLLKKYDGRALLMVTGQCAIHCRYCFRRNFPYHQLPHSIEAWEQALTGVAGDQSIEEVILSGGDPLMLADRRLRALVERIDSIAHVVRLRLHTRMPVVLPSRVTRSLIDSLTGSRLTPIMVIHANSAQELSAEVAAALQPLRPAEILLLNQAVLLRGVNDSADAQVALSRRLIQIGVIPYYLHQLDRATGVAHFEVPVERGREIIQQLRRRLPGYAVPRYVREVAGGPCKEPLEGTGP
jgi:L-lysine 2,3-aminomutase